MRARQRILPFPEAYSVASTIPPWIKSGSRVKSSPRSTLIWAGAVLEIVRQNTGGHAHSNALSPQHEQKRHLGRQTDRFLHSSVIGVDKTGQVRVEKGLAGKRGEAAFNVPGC